MEIREGEITRLLDDWSEGGAEAEERLMALIYPHLRKIASRRLSSSGKDLSLQTTDLVHEAYMRLVPQKEVDWKNRGHFFAVAARVVRRVLVDQARLRDRKKRDGGDRVIVDWDNESGSFISDADWLAMDDVLNQLERIDGQALRVVELRFLVGLSVEETAQALSVSVASVGRLWRFSRAWLKNAMKREG